MLNVIGATDISYGSAQVGRSAPLRLVHWRKPSLAFACRQFLIYVDLRLQSALLNTESNSLMIVAQPFHRFSLIALGLA